MIKGNDKQQKNKQKKNKKKRGAEQNADELENEIAEERKDKRVAKLSDQIKGKNVKDMGDEDDNMTREAEMIAESIKNNVVMETYSEDQFDLKRDEYPNCIHEYVAPRGFVRKEYKKPVKAQKEYKFKLDKF